MQRLRNLVAFVRSRRRPHLTQRALKRQQEVARLRRDQRAVIVSTVAMFVAFFALVASIVQARISVDNERRSLRAYLDVRLPEVDLNRTIRGETLFAPDIWNTGRTPAYEVGAGIQTIIAPSNKHHFELTTEEVGVNLGQVAPGSSPGFIPIQIMPISTSLSSAFAAGRISEFHYGQVRYVDVFGQKHATYFCFVAFSDPVAKVVRYGTCPPPGKDF